MQTDDTDLMLAWALAAKAMEAANRALALARQAGPQGNIGPVGPRGLQGLEGPDGARGEPGEDGEDGAPGRDGRDSLTMLPAHVVFERDHQRLTTLLTMHTPNGRLEIRPVRGTDGLMESADFIFIQDAGNGARN